MIYRLWIKFAHLFFFLTGAEFHVNKKEGLLLIFDRRCCCQNLNWSQWFKQCTYVYTYGIGNQCQWNCELLKEAARWSPKPFRFGLHSARGTLTVPVSFEKYIMYNERKTCGHNNVFGNTNIHLYIDKDSMWKIKHDNTYELIWII